jgi:citrate synthase
MEHKRTSRLVRPAARYVGPGPRPITAVKGYDPLVTPHYGYADGH